MVKKEDIIHIIGRRHGKEVLYSLYGYKEEGILFKDLKHKLDCAASTASVRLKEFVEVGLVEKKALHARAVFYKLSAKGEKIVKLLKEIDRVE